MLLRRLGPLLEDGTWSRFKAGALSWTVDPTAVPPFDLARPEEETRLGRMPVPNRLPAAQGAPRPIVPKAADGGFVRDLQRCLRRWLTTPEPRIAGRMGLFRVDLRRLLYLAPQLGGRRSPRSPPGRCLAARRPASGRAVAPPSVVPGVIESCLVAALVLLLAGLCVGPVTLVVLVLGMLLEAFHQSFGKVEHASVFLVFYIPLFMLGSHGAPRGRSMRCWHAARDERRRVQPTTPGVTPCRCVACS